MYATIATAAIITIININDSLDIVVLINVIPECSKSLERLSTILKVTLKAKIRSVSVCQTYVLQEHRNCGEAASTY
jgi:hypothetical protein